MTQNWNNAAARYQAVKRQKMQEQQTAAIPATPPTSQPDNSLKIAQVATDLHMFMRSEEGRSALALLLESGRHLIFGEDHAGGGYGTVYFINGTGLHRSIEVMGTWQLYSSEVRKPEISPIPEREAVYAAVQYGGKNPNEIMPWLRAELDKIAAAAPQPEP